MRPTLAGACAINYLGVVACASISAPTEILAGLWRVEAIHPEWTAEDDDGSEPGWEPEVGWLALETADGLLLIDPLVEDWTGSTTRGSRRGIRRDRPHHPLAPAQRRRGGRPLLRPRVGQRGAARACLGRSLDDPVVNAGPLPGGPIGYWLADGDELALWLPVQQTLVFGDAMIRDRQGTLRRCPDSWVDLGHREPERLRTDLHALNHLQPKHVLVSHGPVVLGDGPAAFENAVTQITTV